MTKTAFFGLNYGTDGKKNDLIGDETHDLILGEEGKGRQMIFIVYKDKESVKDFTSVRWGLRSPNYQIEGLVNMKMRPSMNTWVLLIGYSHNFRGNRPTAEAVIMPPGSRDQHQLHSHWRVPDFW